MRRITAEIDPSLVVNIPQPIRIGRDRLLKSGELERVVDLAARRVELPGGVLVVIDADDDCPATKAPELVRRASGARADIPTGVVLAHREFGAWFLAGAASLRGQRGLPATLEPPSEPEQIRGAKEWLQSKMGPARTYSPAVDQPALVHALDLHKMRKASRFFDKCWREIARLLDRDVRG